MTRTTLFIILLIVFSFGCLEKRNTSDDKQQAEQEKILDEATAQTGMPNIKNFRERKMMRQILELRDQEGFVTYTYVLNELKGCYVFFGNTIGYPIPYSTQYTNPEKLVDGTGQSNPRSILPQADPNGLFSPSSAEGTWLMMKDPNSDKVGVGYSEPKVTTLPFKMDEELICKKKSPRKAEKDEPPAEPPE